DCDSVMAVTDERGQLLWVRGKSWVLRQAESIRFVEGAQWDERHAGTNAPGTALRLDAPVTFKWAKNLAGPGPRLRWAAPARPPGPREGGGLAYLTFPADGAWSPPPAELVRMRALLGERAPPSRP